MVQNKWYLYSHLKPCGEVFYIGIGQTANYKRAFSKHSRNKFWRNVVDKHSYEVQILKEDMTLQEACEAEINLIAWYGRRVNGGLLVNLTDGGEGVLGIVQTKESLKKRADKVKILFRGEGNPFFGKSHTEEVKKFISDYQKEFYQYSETFPEKVTPSVERKCSRKVIHLITKKIHVSLREASQYYGVNYTTLKGRLQKERYFQGNLWYLDQADGVSEQSLRVINFLERAKVRGENIKQ